MILKPPRSPTSRGGIDDDEIAEVSVHPPGGGGGDPPGTCRGRPTQRGPPAPRSTTATPMIRMSSGPVMFRRSRGSEPLCAGPLTIRAVGTIGDVNPLEVAVRPVKTQSLGLTRARSGRSKHDDGIASSVVLETREESMTFHEAIIVPLPGDVATSVEVVHRPAVAKPSLSVEEAPCNDDISAPASCRESPMLEVDSSDTGVDSRTFVNSSTGVGTLDAAKLTDETEQKNEMDGDSASMKDKESLLTDDSSSKLIVGLQVTDRNETEPNIECNVLTQPSEQEVTDEAMPTCDDDHQSIHSNSRLHYDRSDGIAFNALSLLFRDWKTTLDKDEDHAQSSWATHAAESAILTTNTKKSERYQNKVGDEGSSQLSQNISDAILLSRLDEVVSSDEERSRVERSPSRLKESSKTTKSISSASTDLVLLDVKSGSQRNEKTHKSRPSRFLRALSISTWKKQEMKTTEDMVPSPSVINATVNVKSQDDRSDSEGFQSQCNKVTRQEPESLTIRKSQSNSSVQPPRATESTYSKQSSKIFNVGSLLSIPASQIEQSNFPSMNDTTFTESLIDVHSNDTESSSTISGSESGYFGGSGSTATTVPIGSPRGNLQSRRDAPALPFPPRDLLSLNFSLSSDRSSDDFGSSATQSLFSDNTGDSNTGMGTADSAPSSCIPNDSTSSPCQTPRAMMVLTKGKDPRTLASPDAWFNHSKKNPHAEKEQRHSDKSRDLVAPRSMSRRRSAVVQSLENIKSGENSLVEPKDLNDGNISFETNESAAVEVVRYNLSIGPVSFNYYSRKGK